MANINFKEIIERSKKIREKVTINWKDKIMVVNGLLRKMH